MKLLALVAASAFSSIPVNGFSPSNHLKLGPRPRPTVPFLDHIVERNRAGAPLALAPSPSRLLFAPKGDGDDADDGDTPFVRPAMHNSPFFRSLAIVYALLFAVYQGSSAGPSPLRRAGRCLLPPPRAAAPVHVLAYATWFGTVAYTTFVAGITMFRNLPRRTFGKIQSKLFPLYFRLCSTMIGVQILTLTAMPDVLGKTSEVSLVVAFVATLLNLLYLEPASTRVMFDRYELEDDGRRDSEDYAKAAKSFGRLHGMSSLANLVALCGGIVHGVRLASGLAV